MSCDDELNQEWLAVLGDFFSGIIYYRILDWGEQEPPVQNVFDVAD